MKLLNVTIDDFKGIRKLTIEAGGRDITITGDNGTGKTTIFDAFLWVFFGKDSTWRNEFELKTLDSFGKPIPMIDHSVELVIEHQGQTLRIKKTLSESWVKMRGSAQAEFKGHKTTYCIDDIPMQKKEFDAFISGLFDEGLLMILTDPGFFASKLSMQDRRQRLMEMCGNLTDADVIKSNDALSTLPALLSGRTLEQHRKLIAARKAIINNELKTIPVRVDEATRALPDSGDIDTATLQAELAAARRELDTVETRLTTLRNGTDAAGAEKRLRLDDNRRHQQTLQRNLKENETEIDRMTLETKRLEQQINEKRNEWTQRDAVAFPSTRSDTCPTCGQTLPEATRQAAEAAALTAFTTEKENHLQTISTAGKTLTAHLHQLQARLQKLTASQTGLRTESEERAQTIVALEAELTQEDREPADATDALDNARDELRQHIAGLARSEASILQRQTGEQRIDELKAQEQSLADEYAELERQTFLTEEFMRTKVTCMESKINNRFKLARFRLFEQQVNGALNEVCEVLGPDLVPYNGGLNNAARINTGIDIINTLSEHYGFTAPIFVDNAEAVTKLLDTPAQVIRLVVCEGVKTLKVEPDTGTQENPAETVTETVAEKRVRRPRQPRMGVPAETMVAAPSVMKGPGF